MPPYVWWVGEVHPVVYASLVGMGEVLPVVYASLVYIREMRRIVVPVPPGCER